MEVPAEGKGREKRSSLFSSLPKITKDIERTPRGRWILSLQAGRRLLLLCSEMGMVGFSFHSVSRKERWCAGSTMLQIFFLL